MGELCSRLSAVGEENRRRRALLWALADKVIEYAQAGYAALDAVGAVKESAKASFAIASVVGEVSSAVS